MGKEIKGKLEGFKCQTSCPYKQGIDKNEVERKVGSQACLSCINYEDGSRKYNTIEGWVTIICNYEKVESNSIDIKEQVIKLANDFISNGEWEDMIKFNSLRTELQELGYDLVMTVDTHRLFLIPIVELERIDELKGHNLKIVKNK